jgi:hypothetical protein
VSKNAGVYLSYSVFEPAAIWGIADVILPHGVKVVCELPRDATGFIAAGRPTFICIREIYVTDIRSNHLGILEHISLARDVI